MASPIETPAARPAVGHTAGIAGVGYVVLFITGVILTLGDQPDTSSAPAKVIAYYSDSGHRDKINLGWLILLVAVFCFLWFLSAIRRMMLAIDGDGLLTTVATVGGAVYATMTLVGTSLNTAIKTMSDDTFRHEVYPPLIHAADDAGYVMHSAGGVGIAATIIAVSLAAGRAGLIPGWARIVGIVVGVAAIFSIFFFPQFLIALWILVAGVLLFRARAGSSITERA